MAVRKFKSFVDPFLIIPSGGSLNLSKVASKLKWFNKPVVLFHFVFMFLNDILVSV